MANNHTGPRLNGVLENIMQNSKLSRNTKSVALRGAIWLGMVAVGCSVFAKVQSPTGLSWQPSTVNPNVAAAGSLSVTATTKGLMYAGDTMSGTSLLVLKAPFDVTLNFAGFGNPVGAGGAPMAMNLKLEISTSGVVFDGAADGLNGATVNLPTSKNPSGVGVKLSRLLTAKTNVVAGQYVNNATIVVTQM